MTVVLGVFAAGLLSTGSAEQTFRLNPFMSAIQQQREMLGINKSPRADTIDKPVPLWFFARVLRTQVIIDDHNPKKDSVYWNSFPREHRNRL